MRLGAPLLGTILLLVSPLSIIATYADEAYTNDFHHALLGTPQSHTTFFHRPSAASKASLLYTLSEKLVLGAINPKDGSVVWRQRLSARNSSTGGGYLKAGEAATVIGAVDGEVQAWDAADGRLAWGWQVAGSVKGLEVVRGDAQSGVLVFSEEENSRTVVRKLAADSGKVEWEHTEVNGDQPFRLSSSSDKAYSISLHSALLKGYKIRVTAFDTTTGKQGTQHTLSSDSEVTSGDEILYIGSQTASPLLIWTDKAFKNLKVNILGTKHVATISVGHDDGEAIQKIYVHGSRAIGVPAHFLVHYQAATSHWAEVYHVEPSTGATIRAYSLPKVEGMGAFSASNQGSKVYFTRYTDFDIALIPSTSDEVLNTWPLRPRSNGGLANPRGPLHAVSEVISKGSSNFAVRSALTLSSGDWELIRNGEPVWIRSESVAGTVAAAWFDLGAVDGLAQELAAEARGGILGIYVHRLKRHARDLIKYLPAWVEGLPSTVMSTLSGNPTPAAASQSQQDSFGFDKIILIATERGRVMALKSGNQGKVLWNVKAVNKAPKEPWHVLGMEVEDGVALIRGSGEEFLRLRAITGEILQYQPGGLISALKTSTFVVDTSGKTISIPVNDDGSIKEVPKSELGNGTVIVTQGDKGIVRGWSVSQDAKPVITWEFISRADEEISSITSAPSGDLVASIGKALGDRNVLYKYLNPNLLAITTLQRTSSRAIIYLLDSISGDILYSSGQAGVDTFQAIPLTVAENWIAYSLYLSPASNEAEASNRGPTTPKGHQLIVSELFESPVPNDRGPLGYSSNSSSILPDTGAGDEATTSPYAISQAYLLPGPISKITATSTLQSITPRSLICILPNLNALISIPRSVTDPRRPVGRDPTSAEIEEGLFRHDAQLDFEPKWILTHKREVMGLTNVITTPSLLESTSLVFAYGELDVFGTRVAPIGGFDMLGKGFSRSQLVATVVGLAVVTGALAPMIRKKQIDALWTS